ncbi:MAG TPA: serine/threonine-protein kinase [Polyangiaceae bacterium]|jgi:serine/threonine-protein kinase
MTALLAGKYRMERVLGQGGMGVVVAAMHTALDERVAIKLLLPEALASAETVARFQREARAAVRIKSEHVARVIDVGSVDPAALPLQAALGIPLQPGAPFMVMEYLEGQDLAAVLRAAGPIALTDSVMYVAQAIEAIAEAHSLGIIHRDLKPSNLFLTRRPDGTPLVKVLDFGISKAAVPGAMDAAMTTTSAVLGSPMYMAPEQMIASREVDGRTDVWALGVVLYQLLTGRGPFNGTTMTELCARILQEPHAPIRATRPDVPGEIEAVVARCLEKDRTRRFASVADLAEAIAPFGGQAAALSAERARRLIPRTERAMGVPPTIPGAPIGMAATAIAPGGTMPYAATNPSWSATRGRSSGSSGIWIALAFGLAAIVGGVAVVVLFLAMRARAPSLPTIAEPEPARTATAPTDTTPAATTAAPEASIVPLTPLQAPTVHAGVHPQPTATHHAPIVHDPPPRPTAEPKPDIF